MVAINTRAALHKIKKIFLLHSKQLNYLSLGLQLSSGYAKDRRIILKNCYNRGYKYKLTYKQKFVKFFEEFQYKLQNMESRRVTRARKTAEIVEGKLSEKSIKLSLI